MESFERALLIVRVTVVVIPPIRILLREERHVIFVMELKNVGHVVVIERTSIHLPIRKWIVQIAQMVGVVDVMAQEGYKIKGGGLLLHLHLFILTSAKEIKKTYSNVTFSF